MSLQLPRHPGRSAAARGSTTPTALTRLSVLCVLSLVAIHAPGSLLAQETPAGELAGRVVDSETGDPVNGAVVVLDETAPRARGDGAIAAGNGNGVGVGGGNERNQDITDDDGRFLLSPVPAGLHLLTVQHLAYGEHQQTLQVEGEGVGTVEITLSRTAIRLDPVTVDADASRRLQGRGSPSSRNVITRKAIADAASSGLDLGDFLDREVAGVYMQRNSAVGGPPCIEFRGARRGDGLCRPPQVLIDGTTVPDPLSILAYYSLDDLQQIQVVPPAEAGVRFGANAGWGVVLLRTRRASTGPGPDPAVPRVERIPRESMLVDWSIESEPYPWARVYSAAFLGNALGLVAGSAVLRECMDLESLRFYRGDDYCGAPALLGSGLAMTLLPALGGGLGARLAGETPRSRGDLGRSILYSIPVFVPGFAIAGLNAGDRGTGGLQIAGMVLMVFGAPALNTLSDYLFRSLQ